MNLHHRPYQSEDDYAHMRRLLVDVLGRVGLPVYATIGDIDWWRATDTDLPMTVIHLWFDTDRLVAFDWPVDDQVDIVVHPDYPQLHDETLVWAEAEYRQRQAGFPDKPLCAWGFTGDAVRNAALTARGYQRTAKGLVMYTQSIEKPADAPSLPTGYTFDHVRGEADVQRRTAVQRDAFESTFMTEAKIRAVQATPTYRPELDVVIVAPDKSYAAFAQIWLDEANRVGVFEPLGVSADHRRRGLGRALMAEGLRRLATYGARIACVQTEIDNTAARALYETTGFTELDRNMAWTRPSRNEQDSE